MRVILINPRVLDTPNHPLGLLYIAACLKKRGVDVSVEDPNFDDTPINIAKQVLSLKPNIIGLSSTTPQYINALNIALKIKQLSNIPIVFGGVHPTILPKEVLKEKCVDFVVIGEGEETFSELCDALVKNKKLSDVKGIGYKKNGKLLFTGPRKLIENLDSIPFPARHLLPLKWYFAPPRIRGVWTRSTATVMASRGCPYRCIYCGSHLMFGRKVRFRTIHNIIEELKELRRDFKIDSVWFADDTFTINPLWVKEFCRELKKLNWKDFKWACQARVNTINYNLLKIMKSAGCVQLDFGVESGSSKVLKILKKDITPEKVIDAFRITKKAGLLRFASFIIGTPGEKIEDIKMTFNLVKKIKPDYADFFFAVPYPGTELYELAEKRGIFGKGAPFNEWLATKHTDKPIMCTDMSEKELIEWRTRLHNLNLIRNYSNLIKNPSFLFGGLTIIIKGIAGINLGLKRLIKTGKVDSLFVEILK
jgi:anaerobic magnesium-protoporphyrin IX monomethyl ester cyclase